MLCDGDRDVSQRHSTQSCRVKHCNIDTEAHDDDKRSVPKDVAQKNRNIIQKHTESHIDAHTEQLYRSDHRGEWVIVHAIHNASWYLRVGISYG